ncbi:MAG: flotillin-like protein FloA [Pirellulaceae bacterium]
MHYFQLLAQEPTAGQILLWALIGFTVLVALVSLLIVAQYGKLWFQAYMSQADVTLMAMVAMGFMRINQRIIVDAKVRAKQSGLDIGENGITTPRLQAHYLAGGNVMGVLHALIAAERAGIDLDFERATAIDLAGRDVREAVQTSVRPKVIDCPDPERSGKVTLSAIAKDGVELRVRARVTVRTNLEQLIGGAVEATIIARVGESIISSIGSAVNHLSVLENPDQITKAVLARGLDAQTAFEIVSIDIADIDVGENIGARLQADQAEADTRVAQAKAELRRAEAVALEQEMVARVVDNRSQVIEAEAEVPLAMAEAFRAGHI